VAGEREEEAFLRRPVSGAALWALRVVTSLYVLAALLAYARWLPRWIDVRLDDANATAGLLGDGLPYVGATWAAALVGVASAAIWCLVGLLIALRRSRDLFGLFLFASFVSTGLLTTDLARILPMQRGDPWAAFQTPVLYVAGALSVPWVYVFPDGRFLPRGSAGLAVVWIGWSLLRVATSAADPNVVPAGVALVSALILSTVFAQVYRYRHADPVQRQQLRWLVLGGLLFAAAFVALIPISYAFPAVREVGKGYLYLVTSSIVFSVSIGALPVLLAVAILRQGLLDIDLLLNRALAHGFLAAVLIAIFVAVSVVADSLFGAAPGSRSLVPAATALPLAILFVLVRAKVVRAAARFMSGRRVRTLMFVDVVDSTPVAVRIGDRAWRDLLERFRATCRARLRRFHGEEVDTAGDGLFASFTGPEDGVRCAAEIVHAVRALGIEARASVHIGEVEIYGESVAGVAVHVAARLVGLAQPNEILVSGELRDILGGSDLAFSGRGEQQLKGLPGMHRVFAVPSGN
jgi:class 3 adenylate cyclase